MTPFWNYIKHGIIGKYINIYMYIIVYELIDNKWFVLFYLSKKKGEGLVHTLC